MRRFVKTLVLLAVTAIAAATSLACAVTGKPADGDNPEKRFRYDERTGYREEFDGFSSTVKRVESENGLSIYGRLFVPEPFRGENKYPLMIMCHGNNAVGADEKNSVVRNAVGNGMLCYTFDFCSATATGKSEGTPRTATVASESLDLGHVIEFLMKEPYVDTDRIVLWGHSMGGAVVGLTLGRYSSGIAGVVLEAPAVMMNESYAVGLDEFAKSREFIVFWGSNDEQINVSTLERMKERYGSSMRSMVAEGAMHSLQPGDYAKTLPVMNGYLKDMGVIE